MANDLVLMSMNGWSEGATGWCANLQGASRRPRSKLADGTTRPVRARVAEGEERERLWARWGAYDQDLDAYADAALGDADHRPEPALRGETDRGQAQGPSAPMTCRRPGGLGLQEDGESEAEDHRHDEGRRDTGDRGRRRPREAHRTERSPETDRERISGR